MPNDRPLEENVAQKVVSTSLQPLLNDLQALSLSGKQAHWHIHGPEFRSLHLALDTVIADVRVWSDDVAERAIALGVSVNGQPKDVASGTQVKPLPTGFLTVTQARDWLVDALAGVVQRTRQGLGDLEDLDLVSQDLVIGILEGLEKHLWMFRAER